MHRLAVIAALSAFLALGASRISAGPMQMPTTEAQSLSGHDLILPFAITGHSSVIVIGFSRGSQKSMVRWDREIGAQVTAKPGVPIYNIAVIQDAPKFIRGMITQGIRALVPAAGHDYFLTVAKGRDELKKAVNFSDADDAYVMVVDAAGRIVYRTHGEPSESGKKELIDQLEAN